MLFKKSNLHNQLNARQVQVFTGFQQHTGI